MDSNLKKISDRTKGDSKNPLGIFARFLTLIYGMASLILVSKITSLSENLTYPLIWFLVLFPVLILFMFVWLVSQHPDKIYGPSDFKEAKHFLRYSNNNYKAPSNYLVTLSDQIKNAVHPYRQQNKLGLHKLFTILQENYGFQDNKNNFQSLIKKLAQEKFLTGLVVEDENIFFEEETFPWKINFLKDSKELIAEKSVAYINSNDFIILDSGSLTLEIARQIGLGLKVGLWDNLKILTNSIPAANMLLNFSTEMGIADGNSTLQLYLVGGIVRPTTLAKSL